MSIIYCESRFNDARHDAELRAEREDFDEVCQCPHVQMLERAAKWPEFLMRLVFVAAVVVLAVSAVRELWV